MAVKRQKGYPRLAAIRDDDIRETLRLLWDQVHNQADTSSSQTTTAATTDATVAELQAEIAKMRKTITQMAAGGGIVPRSTVGGGGSGGTSGGSGSGQPGGDAPPTPVPSNRAEQSPVVAQAKADLVAAAVDLSGYCGSFQITKLVAWRLQGQEGQEGISLIAKGGVNCDGYSVDAIMYTTDGTVWDLLINSDDGTNAEPAWRYAGTRPISDARPPIPPAI